MIHWARRYGRILLGVVATLGAGCEASSTPTVCRIDDPAYQQEDPCFLGSGVLATVGVPMELAAYSGVTLEVCLNESCSMGTLEPMGPVFKCQVSGPLSVPTCRYELDSQEGAPNSFVSLFVASPMATNGEALTVRVYDPTGRAAQRVDFRRQLVYQPERSIFCDGVVCQLATVQN